MTNEEITNKKIKKSKKNPMEKLDEILGIAKEEEDIIIDEIPEFISLKPLKKDSSIPNYLEY